MSGPGPETGLRQPNDNPTLSIWAFTKVPAQQFSMFHPSLCLSLSLSLSLSFSLSFRPLFAPLSLRLPSHTACLPFSLCCNQKPPSGEWVACQDQVCFCPFKAKKPRETFPACERESEQASEGGREKGRGREGRIEVGGRKRKKRRRDD